METVPLPIPIHPRAFECRGGRPGGGDNQQQIQHFPKRQAKDSQRRLISKNQHERKSRPSLERPPSAGHSGRGRLKVRPAFKIEQKGGVSKHSAASNRYGLKSETGIESSSADYCRCWCQIDERHASTTSSKSISRSRPSKKSC